MNPVTKAPDREKTAGKLPSISAEERPTSWNHLHVVRREDGSAAYDGLPDEIAGFDATLMGARTTFSAEEEKKLIRRIDWHLIPLLAVMYMVKSIDASGVCPLSLRCPWKDS